MRPLALIFALWALAAALVQRSEIMEMAQALLLRAAQPYVYWAPVIDALIKMLQAARI